MAKFYGWSPSAVDALTGAELAWWSEQAMRIMRSTQIASQGPTNG